MDPPDWFLGLMMSAKKSISFVALFCACLAGCGTFMNIRDFNVPQPAPEHVSIFQPGKHPAPKLVYGGVRFDASLGRGWIEQSIQEPPMFLAALYVWSVDLPISALADTLTLPITIQAAIDRAIQEYYFPDRDTQTTIEWKTAFRNRSGKNRTVILISRKEHSTLDEAEEVCSMTIVVADEAGHRLSSLVIPRQYSFCDGSLRADDGQPVLTVKTSSRVWRLPRVLRENRTQRFSLTDETIRQIGQTLVERDPDAYPTSPSQIDALEQYRRAAIQEYYFPDRDTRSIEPGPADQSQ